MRPLFDQNWNTHIDKKVGSVRHLPQEFNFAAFTSNAITREERAHGNVFFCSGIIPKNANAFGYGGAHRFATSSPEASFRS